MTGQRALLPLLLRRDRLPVLLGLIGVTVLAWAYLVWMALAMGGMSGSGAPGGMSGDAMTGIMMPRLAAWSATEWLAMFLMWSVMMVGMMLPSAAPMILLYDSVRARQEARGASLAATGVFALGYLLAWTLFSLGATTAQWALEQAALLSPMMVGTSPILGAGLLIAAGIYQLSPLKHVCLRHCRGPLDFIMRHWRKGTGGALVMGIEHGAYCVGCCWFLMGLLFVGGVMNLLWVAAIAIFVLIEKVAPHGELAARVGGAALAGAGLVLLLAG
jgi:predicted metal-binding membrane protein